MIKVDSRNDKDSNVQVRGNRETICVELMITMIVLIENNVIQEKDKKVLKDVLDLDTKSLKNILQKAKATLKEM